MPQNRNTLDLSIVKGSIQQLLDAKPEYHPEGGQCDACAADLLRILREQGFDAEVVTLRNQDFGLSIGRPPVMTAKSPEGQTWILSTDGYHKIVRINQVFYLDSLVISHHGIQAVDETAYRELWEYPDDIEVIADE